MAKSRRKQSDPAGRAERQAALLRLQGLGRLIGEAFERPQAAESLLKIADRVVAAGVPPMSMQEIDAEVKAVRKSLRRRVGRRRIRSRAPSDD